MHVCTQGMPWMPQIIICPASLNEGPMLMHLLRDAQVSADVVTPDLINDFNNMLAKLYLADRLDQQEHYLFHIDRFPMDTSAYSNCLETTNSTKPGCYLLRLLGALLLHETEFETAKDLVLKYIETQGYNNLTEDGLKSWCEIEIGIDFTKYLDSWSRQLMLQKLTSFEGILNLYLLIFDIFELDSKHYLTNEKELIAPQSLSVYNMNKNKIRTVKSVDEFVQFLPWFWEGAHMAPSHLAHSVMLMNQIWQQAMASYLQVDSPKHAVQLYNAFNGKSKDILHNACPVSPPDSIWDVCKRKNLDTACLEYCKILENVTQRQISKLKELLVMATEEMLPLLGMLRACQHPNNNSVSEPQDCWVRIITDKGVCFSTEGG